MNWVDWLILGVVGLSVVGGFREGFIRMGVGFAALIIGFFAASWFYGFAAAPLVPYVSSKAVANIIGFMLIYLAVMVLGTLIAAVIVRAFKLIGLSFLDRILGGAFGFVRAFIVLAVMMMVLMAFAPKRLPAAVNASQFAPYVLGASEVLSAVTPFDIKQGFEKGYAELREVIQGLGPKKKLPVREE